MAQEIEVKFLNIDIETIRPKLKENGAILKIPMRLMKRVMAKTPLMSQKKAFIRLRDEKDKITLTYKQFDTESIDGCYEVELIVDDFEKGLELIRCLNFTSITQQESKRETWCLNEAEVVIDIWPWIAPYIEIEGQSEAQLQRVAETLGFDWKNACFGSVMKAYEAEYPDVISTGFLISDLETVKFDMPCPKELGKHKI